MQLHDSKCRSPQSIPLDRRSFLAGSGAWLGLMMTRAVSGWTQEHSMQFSADPFSLGVASGDPLPDGVVLWTRLAPDPLNSGGMPPQPVMVQWEVATDEGMKRIIKRGTVQATPALGHSVHVEVQGLKPAHWYWYQFKAGPAVSPIGRTRTAPAYGARLEQLTFAFASCQHYEQGLFTAYQHMAAEQLDLVVHLGDYIYEGPPVPGRPRSHNGPELMTLIDYRNRYALYKSDPHLQLAHAAFPWVVTWDDHEVDNNYAGAIDQDNSPPEVFLLRRAQAYQAYYEHMPLRRSSLPRGPEMKLYRRVRYGNLAEFFILDTRQYRTDQPCGDGNKVPCPEVRDPKATLTGPEQERWLMQGLDRSQARWHVIAQQVMLAPVDLELGPEQRLSMDKWSGYQAARHRFLTFVQTHRPSNLIVLTGDFHANLVADLKADFDRPHSAVVGTEFVGTSISSGGDGIDTRPEVERLKGENPHLKFFNGQRGYVRCNLTSRRWQTDFRVVSAVTAPDGALSTRATFIVEAGKPGAVRAG